MRVVPIINIASVKELENKATIIEQIYIKFPTKEQRVQIDVADGSFTNGYANWRSPEELISLKQVENFFIEVDALLLEPEVELLRWIPAGIKRFIFYLETVSSPDEVIALCTDNNIEPVLAFTPKTSFEFARPHLAKVSQCQLLAVNPGLSGQEFHLDTLEKIKAIKKTLPSVVVEIDGGINKDTAKLCSDAGADIIASSSFIFSTGDPLKNYQDLML